MTKLRCKNCEFWHVPSGLLADETEILYFQQCGECENEHFCFIDTNVKNLDKDILTSNDCLLHWDTKAPGTGVLTGPEFGCVHFEKRKNTKIVRNANATLIDVHFTRNYLEHKLQVTDEERKQLDEMEKRNQETVDA